MTFEANKFWDTNLYNNPHLTDDMIIKAELKLGVKLPGAFIDLLRKQNGGYTNGFIFPLHTKNSWGDDHIFLNTLFGIVLDGNLSTAHNIMESEYMTKEWGLPEKQIILSGEGHWWITLDYRQAGTPGIRWIDCDSDKDIHVADSFEDFIQGLIPQNNS